MVASFQMAWCNHTWMSPSKVGAGGSSLFLPESPAPHRVLVTWGRSLPTAGYLAVQMSWHGLPHCAPRVGHWQSQSVIGSMGLRPLGDRT